MSQAIQNLIALIWKTPVAFFRGWWRLIQGAYKLLIDFLSSLGGGWVLLLLSFVTVLVAGWPWFSYQIQFEQIEFYGVRSRFWTFFTFAGVLGMIAVLIQFPYRRILYLTIASVAIVAWIVGLIWPSLLHVNFHPETTYEILLPFWIYPGVLGACIVGSLLLPDEAGWDIAGSYRSLNRQPEPLPDQE